MVAALGLLVVLLPALVLLGPAQADATSLCRGYTGCQNAGYAHKGYRAASKNMYWRMYSGHNCTNYAAYRLIRNGMSSERPWTGTGMAYNWGIANKSLTDTTPTVGSIAWWGRNSGGAGASGHVAYVEQVVSAQEIVVSEDSWNGDFGWRRITKAGSGWPTGFIHFKDMTLKRTATPAISGTPRVGVPLTVSSGSWTPAATSVAYQWYLDGTAVSGATGATWTPTPAQLRGQLTVQVRAGRSGYGTAVVTASAAGRVAAGQLQPTSTPSVAGAPVVGRRLSVAMPGWTPSARRTAVQWYADGAPIAGAVDTRLALTRSQVGSRITVRLEAKSPGYRWSAVEAAAGAPVAPRRVALDKPFAVRGAARIGARLRVVSGAYRPATARVGYAWLRNGRVIPGAKGRSYRVRAADLGKRLTVRVRLARPGFRANVSEQQVPRSVSTVPRVTVSAAGGARRAVVKVRVRAPGARAPQGLVRVKIGRSQREVRMRNGTARVVLRGVAPGRRVVRVGFVRGGAVERGRATARVTVTR